MIETNHLKPEASLMARILGTARFYSFYFGFSFSRSAFCCADSPSE